jgi:hypothetical protein
MYPLVYPALFKGYDGLGVSHRERQIEERHEKNFENLANFVYWDPKDVIYASCQEQCCG